MCQLHCLPTNASAVPHMLLDEIGLDAALALRLGAPKATMFHRAPALLTNSQRAEWMTWQHPDRLTRK
jgi:hypothetical protein